MRLLLIRHGQTIDNVRGALGTAVPGPPLTELGREQAAAIPGALEHEPIEAIYTSTMLRTQLTAEPLARARGLRPEVLDGLQEIYAGRLEQRRDREAVSAYIGTIASWAHDPHARMPDGEDGNEFFGRYTAAIDTIAARHAVPVAEPADGPTIAVISHGAAIRTWASAISRNIDPGYSRSHGLDNTAVVIMEGSPAEGWVTTHWAGAPVGGVRLADATAPDPTGEPESEVSTDVNP